MHILRELQAVIAKRITEIKFGDEPVELYEPINYILSLGGKRLRPAFCLLSCDMFGGNTEEALDPAIGIEMFHNFTLLHDDIMDHAPIRRGQPTVHVKWDTNRAILSGDTMMARAYDFIMRAPEKVRFEVFSSFNKTAIEVCEGQQYDMNFENRKEVSIDEYIEMIRLKTAVLVAVSLKIGAMIANANKEDAETIYLFGENLGIAFQLRDDLLDVFSDEKKFGKTTGGDILENKKTFLFLKALEGADKEQKATLLHLFSQTETDPDSKIAVVKDIYEALKIKEQTNAEIDRYYQKAMEHLNRISIPQHRKSELLGFAGLLKKRDK
ncbi:MAG: polyprenyl synthetase family protein [Bacteroidales bacterium]|nr:polyprenyl synthetase family protein [Bacteroidales bacterium]